jgi:hypothetical protein
MFGLVNQNKKRMTGDGIQKQERLFISYDTVLVVCKL